MYPYPPIIESDEYEDGGGLRAAEEADSADQSQQGTSGCGSSDAPPAEEAPKAKVVKLTVKGGSVESTTFMVPDHPPVATDDPKRPCFAPKMESCTISWQLEKGDLVTDAIIQVYHRDSGQAIYLKELTRAEIDAQSGEFTWDGQVIEGTNGFPAGYLNVSSSPYKVKITIFGEVDETADRAWTYFDILIESITLEWGGYDLLDPERDDIDDDYKEKILGPPANGGGDDGGANEGDDGANQDIGFEETLLNDLVTSEATPTEAVKHDVVLISNLFATKDDPAQETFELSDQTDYNEYKKLWGDGPRIPIVATVKVKTAGGTGTTDAIEALAGATMLWDWQDNEPDRWKTPLTPGETPIMTEPFLEEAYHKDGPAKPPNSCNAPVHFGGKLGEGGAPVFPSVGEDDVFPFKVARCNTRKWASLSHFPKIHEDATPYVAGKEPYRTGVIFQPSRMAGDKYHVSVQLYFEPEFDSEGEIETTAPAVTKAGEFEVFRKIHVKHLSYGAPDFGTDVDACLTATADLYLKEANVIIDHEKISIDKAKYENALAEAIEESLESEEAYVGVFALHPLLYKHLLLTDLPANAPPVIFRELDDFVTRMETAFRDGRVHRFTVANKDPFQRRTLTGATSGTAGHRLTTGTKVEDPVFVLVEDPAAAYTDGETIRANATTATETITLVPTWDFWGVVYTMNEADDGYKKKIDVTIGGTLVEVEYGRFFWTRNVKSDLPETSKTALRDAVASADRNAELQIQITSKSEPSARAQLRLQAITDFLESIVLDRKATFEGEKNSVYFPATAYIIRNTNYNKQIPMDLIPRTLTKYIEAEYEDSEAAFIIHVPGRSNLKDIQASQEATTNTYGNPVSPYQEAQLAGALWAVHGTRTRAIVYLSSLADAANVKSEAHKSYESIFAHEIGHALFLPHAKQRTNYDPGGVVENKHVKGDTCLMNYDLDSEHFCGLCMVRLRGWKTEPGEFDLGSSNIEFKVQLHIGDLNELFDADLQIENKGMAALQLLGLFARPLDHPEADDCFDYAWERAEELFPALAGATEEDAQDILASEIKKYLVGGDSLPAPGEYARLRTPCFPLLYALNYLEAKILPEDQGSPEMAPWENFILGADTRKVEELFYKANTALGKLPLAVEVLTRPKDSGIEWADAEPAPGVSVYFEFIDPQLDDAPDGPASIAVGGGNTYFTSVKAPDLEFEQAGFTNYRDERAILTPPNLHNAPKMNWSSYREQRGAMFRTTMAEGDKKISATNGAYSVLTDGNGIARCNFEPSLIGGDAYKFRVYVGPDTQDKPDDLGDDMIETGTLVHWRSLRVCNHVRMTSPADATGIPDCLKQDGEVYSPNYANYVGSLPDLDLKGHITTEFAKGYVEVLVEAGAENPADLSDFETDIRDEMATLLAGYPDFNRTSRMKGRRNDAMSIFREAMTADPDGVTFRVTLPAKPEAGTLTVRHEGGGKSDAVLIDETGDLVAKPALESHTVDYDARTVEVKFAAPPGRPQQVCYKAEEFLDMDSLLAPIPTSSPFLFNLQLPKAYNTAIGDGTMPMALGEDEKLAVHSNSNPHYFAIDASTLGTVKGFLMTALWRAIGKNEGYASGITLVEAASMDNYTTVPDDAGTQEGKAVGQCVFLFGGNGAAAAKYNALAIHEISHALYLQHAPGSGGASGVKPELHAKLRKLREGAPDTEDTPDSQTEIPCVMSYDGRTDGHHCGKCVANLRGMKVNRL